MNIVTQPSFSTNAEPSPQPVNRLNYIDNIRWVMIILVVLMHINVTYGMEGSWYYVEKSRIDLISRILFGMYGSWVQAFFMGFLFFIAGYFVPGAYDKKGFTGFLAGRMVRLGIPTLFFMLILNPLTILIIALFAGQSVNIPFEYAQYLISFDFVNGSGPLWFAFALLIFSVFYAIMRLFNLPKQRASAPSTVKITNKGILLVIFIISVIAFLIRIALPIGTSFHNMQLCFFTQYIALFILGVFAYRNDWLNNLSKNLAKQWMRTAVFIGLPSWFALFFLGGVLSQGTDSFMGGLHWQSALYAFWESFFCISVCLGILGLFRERYNKKGCLSTFLSDNAFGVYVFHTPILVLISLYLRNFHIYPLAKFLFVALITVPICFGFTYFIRKIPICKKIFS